MQDMPDHKWLHQLEEHWEILTTVGLMFITGIKLLHHRMREKERRLSHVEHISETLSDELYELKMDIKQASKDNADQHQHILDIILNLHKHD